MCGSQKEIKQSNRFDPRIVALVPALKPIVTLYRLVLACVAVVAEFVCFSLHNPDAPLRVALPSSTLSACMSQLESVCIELWKVGNKNCTGEHLSELCICIEAPSQRLLRLHLGLDRTGHWLR